MSLRKYLLPPLVVTAVCCAVFFVIQYGWAGAPAWTMLLPGVPFAFIAVWTFVFVVRRMGTSATALSARAVAAICVLLFGASIVVSVWNSVEPSDELFVWRLNLLVAAALCAAVARVFASGRWKVLGFIALPLILTQLALQCAADSDKVREFIAEFLFALTVGARHPRQIQQLLDCENYGGSIEFAEYGTLLLGLWTLALPSAGLLASARFPGRADVIGRFVAVALLGFVGVLSTVPLIDRISPETETALGATIQCVVAAVALVFAVAAVFPRRVVVESSPTNLDITCPRCRTAQTLAAGETRCSACRLQIEIRIEEPRCPSCSYLLYRLTEPRCPECGSAVADLELPARPPAGPGSNTG